MPNFAERQQQSRRDDAPGRSAPAAAPPAHPAIQLQHTLGNRVAQRILRKSAADRRAEDAAERAGAAARDYADAQAYVTDFYGTYARIHDDLGEAAHRSIARFSETTGIPDSRLGANVTYQLVRIILGILPGARSVISMFDFLSRGLPLAMNGSRLATIAGTVTQRGAAGIFTASAPDLSAARHEAVAALDSLSLLDTEGAARIEHERARTRTQVEAIGRDPAHRDTLLSEVRTALGPLPVYDAGLMRQFEQEFELKLYAEHFRAHGWVGRAPPSLAGIPYTKYYANGVPRAAWARILHLYKQVGHEPQVSIDERFAAGDPDPGRLLMVKILIDWGAPVYWLGRTGGPPETLHTGDDLRQPYRGPRHREVR